MIPHFRGWFTGADPGFQVKGGALKKNGLSGGRHGNFWGISCEKSRFYAKKILFFPILGGGGHRPWLIKDKLVGCWIRGFWISPKNNIKVIKYMYNENCSIYLFCCSKWGGKNIILYWILKFVVEQWNHINKLKYLFMGCTTFVYTHCLRVQRHAKSIRSLWFFTIYFI